MKLYCTEVIKTWNRKVENRRKHLTIKYCRAKNLQEKIPKKGIVSGDLLWLQMILMKRAGVHDFPLDVDV